MVEAQQAVMDKITALTKVIAKDMEKADVIIVEQVRLSTTLKLFARSSLRQTFTLFGTGVL